MHKSVRAVSIALALGVGLAVGGASQAAVVNFDHAAPITIDNATNIATYLESGYSLSGEAASFLPIDGLGTAGTAALVLFANSAVTLASSSMSPFSFTGFDAGRYDPASAATLTVSGLFANNTQHDVTLSLGQLTTYAFTEFAGVSSLRFSASNDLVFDTLSVQTSPVPEPATTAMLVAGLGVLAAMRKRAQGRG